MVQFKIGPCLATIAVFLSTALVVAVAVTYPLLFVICLAMAAFAFIGTVIYAMFASIGDDKCD